MNYATPDAETIRSVWGFTFEALSTEYFEVFREVLNFPCEFTDEILEIAKPFTYTYLSYLGIILPEDFNIPELPPKDAVVDSDYIQLWTDTFAKLATATDAAAIYQWGERIKKQKKELDKWLFISPVDILLFEWAKYPEKPEYPPPALPPLTQANIQLIVLRHHVEYQRLDLFILRAENWYDNNRARFMMRENDSWERFIIKRQSSWLINHTWIQLQLVKWNKIFTLLSEEELHTLSEWGDIHANQYAVKPQFTILGLRDALQKFDADHPEYGQNPNA